MNISNLTGQPANSNARPASWHWDAVQSALPHGLPSGALTVIRIRTKDDPVRAWYNTVGDLVSVVRGQGKPVAYVAVDRDHKVMLGHFSASNPRNGRLCIIPDEDLVVHARNDQGETSRDGCGVPTMQLIQEPIEGVEDDYGPPLVVLDGVERARPYANPGRSDGEVVFPDGVTISKRGVDEWRALDLSGLATLRPQSPTVAVWHDDSSAAHAAAFDVLSDVALVVIEAGTCREHGGFLTVRERPSRNDERLSQAQVIRLG